MNATPNTNHTPLENEVDFDWKNATDPVAEDVDKHVAHDIGGQEWEGSDDQNIAARRNTQQQLNYLNEREAEYRDNADRNGDGWSDESVRSYHSALAEIETERKALRSQLQATYSDPIAHANEIAEQTQAHGNEAPALPIEKPLSAAARKQQEQLAKQVAEVKRFLLNRAAGRWTDMDKRIGLALTKQSIAVNTARLSSDSTQYGLATFQGKLTAEARAFCDTNGLTAQADTFDKMGITRFVDSKTMPLQHQRRRVTDEMAELQKCLDGIDARIAEFTVLLPPKVDEAADHDGDATEATGWYDEPAAPTASEY